MAQKTSTEIAQEKNTQAWDALRRFGQPLSVISSLGYCFLQVQSKYNDSTNLIVPAVSFPLAALAIASVMNFDVRDFKMMLKNYAYMLCKGLLVSLAIFLAVPALVFFTKLNEVWFKDIFTGNMLHPLHGFGFRVLVIFHSINLVVNDTLVKLIY